MLVPLSLPAVLDCLPLLNTADAEQCSNDARLWQLKRSGH